MGSLITNKQAAQLLGCTTRSISRYIRDGLLRPLKKGKLHALDEDEVRHFKESRANSGKVPMPLTQANFQQLWDEHQLMKGQLRTVMRLLDIKYERLNYSNEQLWAAWTQAKSYAVDGWPPHVEGQWADLFVRMHVDDIEQLAKISGEEHPWRPFYTLCTCMWHAPFDKSLREQLLAGRNHMQHLAYLWGRHRGEAPSVLDVIMSHEAEPMKRLLNKLERQKHPKDGSPPKF